MRRQHRTRQLGLGLVELLVAIAIGGVVLGVVASFFSLQSRVARETQARNEVNVQARAVAEAIVQDLRLAGSRAVVDGAGMVAFARDVVEVVDSSQTVTKAFCDASPAGQCVHLAVDAGGGNGGPSWQLSVVYVSSLFLGDGESAGSIGTIACFVAGGSGTNACRRVDYVLGEPNEAQRRVLYRRDVPLLIAADVDALPDPEGFEYEFARGVEAINVLFVCGSDQVGTDDADSCFNAGEGLIREARVSVTVGSDRIAGLSATQELSTTMLNLRSPNRYRTVLENEETP